MDFRRWHSLYLSPKAGKYYYRVSLKRILAKPVRGGEAIKTDRKLIASTDIDAMRTALYYCWRDDEDFIRLEFRKGAENYTLSIFHIDNNSHECFTL